MGPMRVRADLLLLLLLFCAVNKVHAEDLSLTDLEQSLDFYNLRTGGASNERATVDKSEDLATNREGGEMDPKDSSDQGGKNIKRTASYNPQTEIEPDSLHLTDRSGQPSPLNAENIPDSKNLSDKSGQLSPLNAAYVSDSHHSSDRSSQLSPLNAAYIPESQHPSDRSGELSPLNAAYLPDSQHPSDRSGQLSQLNAPYIPEPQHLSYRNGQHSPLNAAYVSDSQHPSDRSGQLNPQTIAYVSPSQIEGGHQLSSDRAGKPSALTLAYSPTREVEANPLLKVGHPNLETSKYGPSEIETDLQQSSDRSAQLNSLNIGQNSPGEEEEYLQLLLDRSGQPIELTAAHSPLSETEVDPQLRSGKHEPFLIAYRQPSDIFVDPQISLDRSSQPSKLPVESSSQSEIVDPLTARKSQASELNDRHSLTSEIEVDSQLKSGQPSPQSEVEADFNLRSDFNSEPSKLTVAYSPPNEIEADTQLRLDRSSETSKIEETQRASPIQQEDPNSDARKNYPGDFISKLKLALTPDDSIGHSATYTTRHIPRNEHIKLNEISGASALIQCSAEGEFYSVLTPWRQCMLCVCVGNHIPQPVCVNCAECTDTGLKVPLPPRTSAAIGEALLSPTHLPFLPKRPIETEFQIIDTERIKITQPSVPPHQVLPKEIARGKVPRSCSPLPNGQPFTHPLNPCQTCVCQQTTGDVQISCTENSQCVLLPEQHANTAIPSENEPIPAPQCANMPPNVLFPHPTDRCKQCQCFEEVSSFNTRALQLYCVSIPGCEIATTSQYMNPQEENVVVNPEIFKASTPRPAFQSPVYTPDISTPQNFGQPGIITPTYMTPSLTQSLPVSPESGFISPQDTLLPHFNPPLIPEEPDLQAIAPRANEKILELPTVLERHNPSEKPVPWPPKTVPALPRRTDGPLLGPPPHESCQPYPPNTMFQHPWNECQVCRCSEHHSIGHTSIEVNCFTKASCCIEPPQLISGDSSGLIQSDNSGLTQQDLELLSKKDIIYLEAKCRMRAPNKPFAIECQVCVCHVVYYFVIAKCTPQPGCKGNQNMLFGGPQSLPERSQSTISIPMNGALQPPIIDSPQIFMTAGPKFQEPGIAGPYGLNQAKKLNQMYEYQSSNPLNDKNFQYSSQQQQYPHFPSQQYNQNFIPKKNYGTPLPYHHQGFGGQNFLVNPQEKLLAGYQQQLNSQRPFESRYPNHLVGQNHLANFGSINNPMLQNTFRPNYAQSHAIAHAQAGHSWAQARTQNIHSSLQYPGSFENYRQDLTHDQPLERYDPASNNSNSYAYSSDVHPENVYPTNVYPTSVYPTNVNPTNAYPTNVYPTVNEYPTTVDFLYPSKDTYGRSDEEAAIKYEQGRGQCQYEGDIYLHQCQTCRCVKDPHKPGELYSLCSGTPCH